MMRPTTQTTEGNNGEEQYNCCTVIATMTVMSAMITIIIVIWILIWYQKRRTGLKNLIKHHKESVENSYTSSKHSCESHSKSPDPEYDVIKINPSTDKLELYEIKIRYFISSVLIRSVKRTQT